MANEKAKLSTDYESKESASTKSNEAKLLPSEKSQISDFGYRKQADYSEKAVA